MRDWVVTCVYSPHSSAPLAVETASRKQAGVKKNMAARNFLILFCFFSHSALTWATLPYCGSDSYKYTPLQRGDNGKEYTLKQVHVIIRWVLIHAFVQHNFFFSPIFRIFYKIYIKLFPRVLIFLKFGCGIFKIAWFVSPNVVGKSRHSLTRIISFPISLRLVCTLRLQ